METTTNKYGEIVTRWFSHQHPDNPNYMQGVFWTVWEKPDGRTLVGFNLGAGGKTYFIYNIDKETAIKLYTDHD